MRRRAMTVLLVLAWGCGPDKAAREAKAREEAKSLVAAATERLDGRTTRAGGYVRPGQGHEFDLPESDPWGRPLKATYSSGGFMEVLTVRSAGPDGRFFNADDVVESRSKTTLAGVGNGLKKNVEEFNEKAARGFGRGLIKGVADHLGRGPGPAGNPEGGRRP